MHLAVDAHGNPLRALITKGTTADSRKAAKLIENVQADALLADRGYDTNAIIQEAQQQGMEVVIPPKKNRTIQRTYDKCTYKARHLVENAFFKLKQWRGIATRYAKNARSFLAIVQIRCLKIWLDII